ncbi:porin [Marinobacter adhaerens]|uniref:Porin n=1 Tax=Marinobacter adhaerens TaxID=1033846 RepID=A0A851HVG8_9GAMM|nr:porin [Marinobacter adhaerens]NWN92720.1 porin [Marinobacter adhaerens]
MKKTLIASAIAAATISGTAMAQESNLPTIYGNIQYAITHDNFDGGPSTVDHFDNGSTLGILHDHEIAPGITGFFKLELEDIEADDKAKSSGIDGLDEAYIGVRGDSFGQVWVGSDDSMYETSIDEISNLFEVATMNLTGLYDTGEGDLVQYMSPSFGGLTLGAAVQVNGDNKEGGKSYPYQLAAIYEVDGLELAFSMDSNDGKLAYSKNGKGDPVANTTTGEITTPRDSDAMSVNNENTYGLRVSGNLDNLRLTGQFQTRKDVADIYGLMGVYTLGKNQFALAYEYKELDGDAKDNADGETKNDTITLQALHNLSDHMYVYVEGYFGGGDDVYNYTDSQGNPDVTDERSMAAVGAVYYF